MDATQYIESEEFEETRTDKCNKVSYDKLTRDEWKRIEQQSNPYELCVCKTMIKLGKNKMSNNKNVSSLFTCGEKMYIEYIRPELIKLELVNYELRNENPWVTVKNKKTKGKKGKSFAKENIIYNNSVKHLKHLLTDTISLFPNYKLNFSYEYINIIEIRLIMLMYHIKFILNNYISESLAYETIIITKKILKIIESSKFKSYADKLLMDISISAQHDLIDWLDKLIRKFNFNVMHMINNYPHLIISANYNNILPNFNIKPYQSQINLMNCIRSNNSVLCFYNTIICSGKTTIAIAISSYVKCINDQRKVEGNRFNLQILFCCSIEPVRHQIGKLAYNSEIPFGIANMKHGIPHIINHFSCKQDENRILIIADLETTLALLEQDTDYILFLDEPTVGADQKDNIVTKMVAKIMLFAPQKTILSSATLPKAKYIPDYIDIFKKRHPDATITTIYSHEAIIGCEIIAENGEIIAPHSSCTNKVKLNHVIECIKTNPFLERLYTAPIIYNLRSKMAELQINDLPDLEKIFSNITNLSQNKIQEVALELLQILANCDDNIIKIVCVTPCKTHVNNIMSTEDEKDNELFTFDDNIDIDTDDTFNLQKLGTAHAHKYLGGCLIVTPKPIDFARNNFLHIIDNLRSASNLIKKYWQESNQFNKYFENLKTKYKNANKISMNLQNIKKSMPVINFPSYRQINTIYHINKYAKGNKNINSNLFRQPIILETLPLNVNIPDDVILLLFSGVGLYHPSNSLLDPEYTNLILNLVANNQLAFMIADNSICYGANYPFNHVIITDNVAKHYSINTIFHLMGRAGRVGQSWIACAHIGSETIKRIIKYIHEDSENKIPIEAINMTIALKSAIKENNNIIPKNDTEKYLISLKEIKNKNNNY